MESLIDDISKLQRSPVSLRMRNRMLEFAAKGREDDTSLFKELCFCLLTANYTSEGAIRIQKAVGDGFLSLSEGRLARKLRSLGYRFPNTRARYIAEARSHREVGKMLRSFPDEFSLRQHIADNILGLGFKESSHFLRNIGYTNLAIIDFHVIDVLVVHGIIEKPKSASLSRKKYLEIENLLGQICGRTGLSQGELDLYLWYMETGKILK